MLDGDDSKTYYEVTLFLEGGSDVFLLSKTEPHVVSGVLRWTPLRDLNEDGFYFRHGSIIAIRWRKVSG